MATVTCASSAVPMRLLLLSLVLWMTVAASASTASAAAASTLFPRDRPLRTAAAAANATSVAFRDAIVDARPANLSDSYDLVARVALRSFSLAFDAAPADGRVHSVHSRNGHSRTLLGPLAHELLASLGPEGAALVQHVAPRLVFDAADRSAPPVALHDELRVDLNALFMHNVGATQVLMRSLHQLQRDLVALQQLVDDQQQIVFNLTSYLEQEASAQLVEKRRISEAEAAAAEARVNETLARGEQERETLDKSLANELELEKRRHELANERLLREDEARKEQNRDLVRLQEEANVRLEMSRRETENLLRDKQLALEREKALLERNTTLEKAAMDVEGRIRQQRANQDIERAQLAQRLEAEREKLLLAMQTAFDNIGRGAAVLLAEDKEKLVQLVGALVALAAGVFLSREAVRVAGALIQQRLGKPSLVRETSRVSGVVGLVRVWGSAAVRLVSGSRVPPKSDAMLNDVVLGGSLETRVREIARATRNAALHGAPYRHLLLYGPPGTGKTMVAKRLASGSGMDYAILSGGDVGPLGSDAVTELHALFAWANASPRGVLIFIDEAEAFLGCRASRKTHMSEAMRNALNALLFHTGSPSKSFMLVIATNRPEDLDAAVTDRIDDALHFDLPEAHERVRLLEMYFDEYVGELAGENSKLGKRRRSATSMLARLLTGGHSDDDTEEIRTASATDAVDPVKPDARAMLAQYGELTAGMSGREIAKTMLYLQSVVYAQDELAVPRALVDRVLREKADEHRRKLALKAGSSMGNSAMSLGEGVFV